MKKNFSKIAINHLLEKTPNLQLINKLLYQYQPLNEFDNIEFSKNYLYPHQITNFEQLNQEIPFKQLRILDIEHKHTLKWQLVNSSVTNEDLLTLEKKWNLKIPDMFKDYLQSYALPLCYVYGRIAGATWCFSYNTDDDSLLYDWEEEDIMTTKLTLNPMFFKHELNLFKEQNKIFLNSGYIYIGNYNEYHYVLLDTVTEQIVTLDHEIFFETREHIKARACFFFHNFNDLLRCYFFNEIYDEDEREFIKENK